MCRIPAQLAQPYDFWSKTIPLSITGVAFLITKRCHLTTLRKINILHPHLAFKITSKNLLWQLFNLPEIKIKRYMIHRLRSIMLTFLPHVSVKWRDQKTCDDKHMIYK